MEFVITIGAGVLGLMIGGVWRVFSVHQYNKLLEQRISALEVRQDKLESKIETRLDKIESKIDTLLYDFRFGNHDKTS